jgi:hypothetical protein
MDHANTENETTSAKGEGGATNADAGNTAAAAGAVNAPRAGRGGKAAPKQAGEGETTETSNRRGAKPRKAKAPADDVAGSKAKSDPAAGPAASKLDQLVALLRAPGGATLPELQSATGWQVHSVRGTMAGALRKKGHNVISEKPVDGLRRYRIGEAS